MAATQTIPAGGVRDLLSSHIGAGPYTRLVKEEVLDPGYGSQSPSTYTATTATPVVGSVPSATALPTPSPVEAVKRPSARKTGGSKAKKVKAEPKDLPDSNTNSQSQIQDHMVVQKKKRDRFKGTTEAEVLTRVLPDHIREDLDILIVGINPGLTAAYVQHHYAGPGNHFWKCLYLSGMIPEPMNALQDAELLNYGIGFTNIVARTTRGSADLTRKEIFEGGEILKQKMLKYLPKIALFNGKGIYEVFCGHKKFHFGLQPEPFPGCPNTCVFVNPSSSARCTQLPRAVDKVPFYNALKLVRDHIRAHGSVEGIDRSTVTFPDFKLVTAPQKVKKEVKEEPMEATAKANDNQVQIKGVSTITSDQKQTTDKPKKSRGRPKKEKPIDNLKNEQSTIGKIAASNPVPQPKNFLNYKSNMDIHHSQNSVFSDLKQSQIQRNSPLPLNMSIKQEVMDGTHPDKDLTALLTQSINASLFQQQQQSLAASSMMQRSLNGNSLHPSLMMPVSVPSTVKQEMLDWSGCRDIPTYSAATSTSLPPYPQYSCYWNYLPHPSNTSFMANPYSTIPTAPHIAHQQAVAAASALHPSMNVSQAGATAGVSDSLPQEASSPAMSSQSNLTQASLDSLPKADSASTVANWLQNIPNAAQ